jgi:hypothetical protein
MFFGEIDFSKGLWVLACADGNMPVTLGAGDEAG